MSSSGGTRTAASHSSSHGTTRRKSHQRSHSKEAQQHTKQQQQEEEMEEESTPASSASSSSSAPSTIPPHFPSCLHTEGVPYSVRILHDRLTATYVTKQMHALDVGTVRSNRPVPNSRDAPIYYFECAIESIGEKNQITIGLAPLQSASLFVPGNMHAPETPVPHMASTRQHETASLTCRQLGCDLLSYGYRADEGKKYHGPVTQNGRTVNGVPYATPSGVGDTIGCGINHYDSSVFFTRNGKHLGTAYTLVASDWAKDLPLGVTPEFYAAVSMHSKGEQVKVNFGQIPFAFDVTSYQKTEKLKIQSQIAARTIDSSIMLPLIRSYFINQGYERSLNALNRMTDGTGIANESKSSSDADVAMSDVPSASNSTPSSSSTTAAASPSPSSTQLSTQDQIGLRTMSQRRAIRDLIESGSIDLALTAINELTPHLFTTPSLRMLTPPHDMRMVQFRLHSLQFIQLLTSSSPTRLIDGITFAQQHLAPYQQSEETSLRDAVNQLMGLLAYTDITTSPLAHITKPEYRTEIASQVNSALLAGLNAPKDAASSTHGTSALEIIVRQACTIETVYQQHNLPLALPNVRETWKE